MTKTGLLADLQREQEQWEALLAQIGESRMDQGGVTGEWSIKDVVAHLTGWTSNFATLKIGVYWL